MPETIYKAAGKEDMTSYIWEIPHIWDVPHFLEVPLLKIALLLR